MNTILALALLATLLGGVLVLLQRNHRRTSGWPRTPYGGASDPGEADLRRIWLDLMAGRH